MCSIPDNTKPSDSLGEESLQMENCNKRYKHIYCNNIGVAQQRGRRVTSNVEAAPLYEGPEEIDIEDLSHSETVCFFEIAPVQTDTAVFQKSDNSSEVTTAENVPKILGT